MRFRSEESLSWWRHEMETFSALLALCEGNPLVDSPHKGHRRGALMFSLICPWTNGWENNRETGDLRRHRAHYYVIVMYFQDTSELFFEDVRVPKSAMLGEENKGFYYLMSELPQERLCIANIGAAAAEWMFEETRAYVRDRKAFGKTIADLQVGEFSLKYAYLRKYQSSNWIAHPTSIRNKWHVPWIWAMSIP